MTTREEIVDNIRKYLQRETTSGELAQWAETAMMESDFDAGHLDAIRDVVARLGVSDVREFGLPFDECDDLLRKLGYSTKVDIVAD